MSTPSPISDEDLFAYALGEGTPEHRGQIERAVRESAEVRARLQGCTDVITQIRAAGALVPAFALSRDQAMALRRLAPLMPTAAPEPVGGVIDAISRVARLVYDSWATPAVAGLRGVAADRLLRFEFPGGEVDVRVAPDLESPGRFWITGEAGNLGPGEVLARPASGTGSPAAASAPMADSGYFEMCIDSGVYTLELSVPTGRIVVGPIEIERRDRGS